VKLGFAGDTMLGRLVGERLLADPAARLFSEEVVEAAHEADLFICNLECTISDRGERWPDPAKPFFFRAPPAAVEVLRSLGVGCVTLANNHALDFGFDALADTITRLADAGIAAVGAGSDVTAARRPVTLHVGGLCVGILAFTDHPADFSASDARPGVAYAEIRRGTPAWLTEAVAGVDADIVVVLPHWGPNMVASPVPHVRAAAAELRRAGATLVVGTSAHVFHGVAGHVLFDLGDFIDDYAVDPVLRNDLGLMFFVTVDERGVPGDLEAVPLALDFCHTRLADRSESAWIADRFRASCAAFGTQVHRRGDRLVVAAADPGWSGSPPR
jgi:poly-gamma-glutamate capsule biosynthesis protein CapA/YwtB (metallophosphatase superfamily)